MESIGKPIEASCTPVVHAPVTVTNVNDATTLDTTKIKASAGDPCATPKKMPAKPIFKKEVAGTSTNNNTTMDADEESFQEFLTRVKAVALQDTRSIPTFDQLNSGMASPQQMNLYPLLPDYARYQEAKMQRALSRGNSFSSLNNGVNINGTVPMHSPASSPGAEWVSDSRSTSARSIERAWNEDALIARHAFPSSIFCSRPTNQGGTPSPESSLDLSEVSESGQGLSIRRSSLKGGKVASKPDVLPALSFSSSSWSEEEQMGVRKFMQLLERSPSFASPPSRPSSPVRRETAAPSPPSVAESTDCGPPATMVEISPGVNEPLRRASETVTAVRLDFYVPISCFGCTQDIFCIADAKYVICPGCRVVSPVDEGALDGRSLKQHGLGLGFTCETLFQIQSDILSER